MGCVGMPAQRWRELADRLAARIESGEFPAGAKMPTTKELLAAGESKPSVERAYRELVELGLVARKPRVGTVVRSRVPVRVPLSRYGAVLRPGGDKGPWETAVAAVGLAGSVVPLTVERVPVPADVAVGGGGGGGAPGGGGGGGWGWGGGGCGGVGWVLWGGVGW
ncbi:winged helix-turn-helix domain-containing protein, partial [Streptomyces sp. NPDC059385]|uniref:winged helix-turn-helix domain-containing protein n=1 Tax=Streptomyces sp. NPDC059385 TaxID=3346817 RepID=UPI00367CA0D0